MRKDLHHNIKAVQALDSSQKTATATGDVIDLQGFESCEIVTQTAAVTTADGSNYFTMTVYEDDAVGMGTEAVATDLLGTATVINASATQLNSTFRFGYNGNKRYIRVKAVETGTADAVIGAVVILGNPHEAPVA